MMIFMAGVGLVVLSGSLLEKWLLTSGKVTESEIVGLLLGLGLPMTAIGGIAYVIVKASKAFLYF